LWSKTKTCYQKHKTTNCSDRSKNSIFVKETIKAVCAASKETTSQDFKATPLKFDSLLIWYKLN
jgi:hypothetical protein